VKLRWGQNLSPLIICQRHFFSHRKRRDLPPESRGFCVFGYAEADRQETE
jgi:hypothetical protein